MVFTFILLLGGWFTSEYISSKHTKANKQLRLTMAKLERENSQLQHTLTRENDKYAKLKDDYEKIKEAKQMAKAIESEYRNLHNRYTNNNRGIEIIRKTVASKKYINNSLAKEINLLMSEHLPDDKQMQINKAEDSREAFKRIKEGM